MRHFKPSRRVSSQPTHSGRWLPSLPRAVRHRGVASFIDVPIWVARALFLLSSSFFLGQRRFESRALACCARSNASPYETMLSFTSSSSSFVSSFCIPVVLHLRSDLPFHARLLCTVGSGAAPRFTLHWGNGFREMRTRSISSLS